MHKTSKLKQAVSRSKQAPETSVIDWLRQVESFGTSKVTVKNYHSECRVKDDEKRWKNIKSPELSFQLVPKLLLIAIGIISLGAAAAAQDVELSPALEHTLGVVGSDNEQPNSQVRQGRSGLKNLDEFLETLPILSVGQKHVAKFECELDAELNSFRLIWLRLSRANERDRTSTQESHLEPAKSNSTLPGNADDIMLISLNQKIITPDKRFKVHRVSSLKWTLNVENVNANDGESYYLCQVSSASTGSGLSSPTGPTSRSEGQTSSGSWFVGGARLNVLVPPKIVEEETSPSQVQANEFEELVLRCKVTSEPQAQLMWKREDGRSLDETLDVEQQFRHETKRDKAKMSSRSQIISIDSSKLIFSPFRRHHSAAYLCIASNGVQPGVSQRVSVQAVNCRANVAKSAPSESCELQSSSSYSSGTRNQEDTSGQHSASTSTSTAPSSGRRKVWKSGQSSSGKLEAQRRLLEQRADKRRVQTTIRNDGQVSIRNSSNNNNGELPSNSAQGFQTALSNASLRALISLVVIVRFLFQ